MVYLLYLTKNLGSLDIVCQIFFLIFVCFLPLVCILVLYMSHFIVLCGKLSENRFTRCTNRSNVLHIFKLEKRCPIRRFTDSCQFEDENVVREVTKQQTVPKVFEFQRRTHERSNYRENFIPSTLTYVLRSIRYRLCFVFF